MTEMAGKTEVTEEMMSRYNDVIAGALKASMPDLAKRTDSVTRMRKDVLWALREARFGSTEQKMSVLQAERTGCGYTSSAFMQLREGGYANAVKNAELGEM